MTALQKGVISAFRSIEISATKQSLNDLLAKARARIADRDIKVAQLSKRGGSIRLTHSDKTRGALVGPDMSKKGKFRVTYFDKDGPSGHTEHNSLETALRDALQQGYFSKETAAASYNKGDKVEVESDDGEWYAGKVVSVKGSKVSVIYDGEVDSYSVPAKYVRPLKPTNDIKPVSTTPAATPEKKTYTREDFTDAQFKLGTKAWKTVNDLVSLWGEKARKKVYEVHHLFETVRPALLKAIIDGETDENKLIRDALDKVGLGHLTNSEEVDTNIGRSWPNSRGVTRRITGKIIINGEERYTVRDDDQTGRAGEEIIRPDELEDRVSKETKLADSNAKFKVEQDKQQAERDAKETDRRSLDGFEDSFTTPMARERAIQTLTDGGIQVNGIPFRNRKEAIRDLVEKGYRLDTVAGKRVLMSPSDTFLDEKKLTKIGLDYAEHLIKSRGN